MNTTSEIPSVRSEFSALTRLAAPIALTQAGQALMGVVDTAVMGRVGAAQLGAVGLGNGLFFTVSVLGIGLMLGMDPLLSQAIGAKAPARARQLLWQGVWIAVVSGVLISLPLSVMPAVLRPIGTDPEVAGGAWTYVLWRLPGLPSLLVFTVQRAYLQSVGRPGAMATAAVVANVANLAARPLARLRRRGPAGVDRAAPGDARARRRRVGDRDHALHVPADGDRRVRRSPGSRSGARWTAPTAPRTCAARSRSGCRSACT